MYKLKVKPTFPRLSSGRGFFSSLASQGLKNRGLRFGAASDFFYRHSY